MRSDREQWSASVRAAAAGGGKYARSGRTGGHAGGVTTSGRFSLMAGTLRAGWTAPNSRRTLVTAGRIWWCITLMALARRCAMPDRVLAEYRAAIVTAEDNLTAHRKGCHDCQAAKAARSLNRMCVKGWRLRQATVRVRQLTADYLAEQAQLAERQPALFEAEGLG